ncbi:MAG: ABC transporter permease [Acidobacteria bacterium]|nr:ABC transporter permease [Acidobacteriota bacterium]
MFIPLKYILRSLFRRKTRSVLTILGISAVIAIFVAMVSFARGMAANFAATGSADNVVVLQKGAFNQALSSLPRSSSEAINYLPQLKQQNGRGLASPELVIEPWVTVPGKAEEVFMMARGVEPIFFEVEDKIRIVDGPRQLRGNLVLLGRAAQHKLGGIRKGSSVRIHGESWTVAGTFEAGGTNLESAILADLTDLMRAAHRTELSSFTLKVGEPSQVREVVRLIEDDRRFLFTASREPDYYAASGQMFAVVGQLGLAISLIVTLGAVFGAMNTMYTSVAGRMREIGTLRAIGLRRNSILFSLVIEALLLSLAGGAIGIAFGCLVNGAHMGVLHANIRITVTSGVILSALLLSVISGILGGILPARAAARIQVVEALRRL